MIISDCHNAMSAQYRGVTDADYAQDAILQPMYRWVQVRSIGTNALGTNPPTHKEEDAANCNLLFSVN
jgi:hypothetical protein